MSKFIQMPQSSARNLIFPLLLLATIVGCNDSDSNTITPPPEPMEYSYQISVSNLTYAQPLSPITIVLHGDEKLWRVGESASKALENLAESGDNSDLIALDNIIASTSGESPLLPGNSAMLTINTTDTMATHLSVATMLVNTNDAFSGLTGLELSTLDVNQAMSWNINVYDAGTEANSEMAGTIPGPADGGTGFDEIRDDIDVVTLHSGVVSQHDGLTQSILTQAHRFDNPAIKLTITRLK